MFIPLSTDRPPKRRPIVNETLITINLLVYLVGLIGHQFADWSPEAIAIWGHYDPQNFVWWRLITYQFIHDPYGVGHIIFNLIFLWVFGNAVESRLGRIGYLGFYLIGGVVAGIVHGMASAAPVIGASGSIAAVSGAFLALFPRARIRVLFVFFIIGMYMIPAAWFIAFYFAIDLARAFMGLFGRGENQIAVMAHLGGYVYGFFVCFSLLGLRVLTREEMDIFFLFQQMRRRQAFRTAVQKSPGVWDQPKADTPDRLAKRKSPKPMTEQQQAYAEGRAEVSRLLASHEIAQAMARYRNLLRDYPDAVMPEQRQVDLANAAYQESDIDLASRAYELYLDSYPRGREANHVRLILALIYARRLSKPERARELIADLRPKLQTEGERALVDQLEAELA